MSENSGIDLLIETEIKLGERLADAQREAEATLEAARLAQQKAEANFRENLEQAARDLAVALAAQCEREVSRIKAEADTSARRFEALGPERLDAMARQVAQRVLDSWRTVGAA